MISQYKFFFLLKTKMVLRTTLKLVSPPLIKTAFWGTVLYVGPVVAISAVTPVGFIAMVAVVHLGGPELLTAVTL